MRNRKEHLTGIAAIALAVGCVSHPSAEVTSAPVRAEMENLKSGDPRVRVAAVRALCEMRSDESAARVLVARMNDEEGYDDGMDANGHPTYMSPGWMAQVCLDEFGSIRSSANARCSSCRRRRIPGGFSRRSMPC
jgi:hypothetical protein